MTTGAFGGMYQTQMYKWAEVPNTFGSQLTLQGGIIAINKKIASQLAGRAAQAAVQQKKPENKPPQVQEVSP
jgi:hypothetical protein